MRKIIAKRRKNRYPWAESRGQRAEDRGQRTEDRGQRAEGGGQQCGLGDGVGKGFNI